MNANNSQSDRPLNPDFLFSNGQFSLAPEDYPLSEISNLEAAGYNLSGRNDTAVTLYELTKTVNGLPRFAIEIAPTLSGVCVVSCETIPDLLALLKLCEPLDALVIRQEMFDLLFRIETLLREQP